MAFECHCGEVFGTYADLLNHELETSVLTDLVDADLLAELLQTDFSGGVE